MGHKKANTEIELDKFKNIKIITTPQYLGLIIGFVFTIGMYFQSYKLMKNDIDEIKNQNEKNLNNILTKIDKLDDDISKEMQEINERTIRIESKIEFLRELNGK